MSGSTWNSPVLNQKMRSPIHRTGVVMVNGALDKDAILAAIANKTPLYPLPRGVQSESFQLMRNGEIAYKLRDGIHLLDEHRSADARTEDTGVRGLTSINGQGYGVKGGDTNESFMSKIQIVGIVMQETEDNKDDRCNFHIGGLHTVSNNGNSVIQPGDWVIAYAPKPEEVHEGGLNNAADRAGRTVLWYKPYRASDHKLITKNIYDCILGKKGRTTYLSKYKRTCHDLLDSMNNIIIVALFVLLDHKVISFHKEFKVNNAPTLIKDGWEKTSNPVDKLKALEVLAHVIGSRDFKSGYGILDNSSKLGNLDDLKGKIILDKIERLFVPFSTKEGTNEIPWLFKKPTESEKSINRSNPNFLKKNRIESIFRGMQQNTVALYLQSSAALNKYMVENIIGQAKTGAKPKYDFELQLRSYAR